jgi:hypothetical protein
VGGGWCRLLGDAVDGVGGEVCWFLGGSWFGRLQRVRCLGEWSVEWAAAFAISWVSD